MKYLLFLALAIGSGCHRVEQQESLSLIQIQDRNGLTETISHPERLTVYESVDFFTSQPYKKVQRIYKAAGKNHSKITAYHPNGMVWQYLEAEEMRAHGSYREWFPNGQLKIEATVIGGTADISPGAHEDWLFDGMSKVWDEQGHLVAEIPYQDGVLEGTSTYFHPSGQIERQIPFTQNKMEGEALCFAFDGALKSRVQYKNGIKEGMSLGYFSAERLAWEEQYSQGLLIQSTYYTPQGALISEIANGKGFHARYDDGALILTEFRAGKAEGAVKHFTSSGELQRTYCIRNGQKQGEEIEFYLTTEIDSEAKLKLPASKLSVTWNENAIHGPVKTWYNNGQLRSQREYCRNQRSGSSLAWYRNGSFMLLEEYEEDQLLSGQYYKLGKKDPISTIINGNGVATLHDETGAVLRKVSYLKGKALDPQS